jgi:hypothetical protein
MDRSASKLVMVDTSGKVPLAMLGAGVAGLGPLDAGLTIAGWLGEVESAGFVMYPATGGPGVGNGAAGCAGVVDDGMVATVMPPVCPALWQPQPEMMMGG